MKNTGIKIFISVLVAIHFLSPKTIAQTSFSDTPGDYYNRFTTSTQRNLNEATALFCIGKLASNEKAIHLLQDLVHNNYAQVVIKSSFPAIMPNWPA